VTSAARGSERHRRRGARAHSNDRSTTKKQTEITMDGNEPPMLKIESTEMSESRRIWELLLGLGVIVLAIRHLQFSTDGICCGDLDGYYHIRWSQLLWEHLRSGHLTPPQFTWLPLTTLNPANYVDQHLFFHILQIPFTWFHDLVTGAKFSSSFLQVSRSFPAIG